MSTGPSEREMDVEMTLSTKYWVNFRAKNHANIKLLF